MESQDTILLKAREIVDPEERAAYLTQACGNNADLRTRIEAMLRDAAGADKFFGPEATAEHTASLQVNLIPDEAPGNKIGPFKLLQKIGEGGCGVVYMAEQQVPVRRRVALKIIKIGMDTQQVVARFEAERQALALMDHPNIARVLDAGTTEKGRPYFVMELVRGVPITEFCDQGSLTTRERLELFIQVCKAIQHAHQKGIIHRDIKPSNVLVTLHDGVPVPKVIDFGVAKAIDQPLTEKTLFTRFGQFIGTPAYMSPEQAEMSGLDIDTRSDIYSLGVLLYELLTGRPPFDPKDLLEVGLDEMRRTIREQEPPPPSQRLSTLADADLTATAKLRRCEPAKLPSLIRGDLDWIVMKALEKDRARRYDTTNGLAMDIQRHMTNEPVLARPPSNLYRFQKLVRRNKLLFASATAVAVAITIGATVSLWQAIRATRAERVAVAERNEAEQARNVALNAEQREEQLRNVADNRAEELRRNLYFSQMNLSGQAAELLSGLGRVEELLAPWQQSQPDLRGWEWYYLNGLLHRDLRTLRGHIDEVSMAVWSPDGTRLASASRDGTARIWDPMSGRQILILKGHTAVVRSVAWSPDGARLATASQDRTIKIWDATSGRQLLNLVGHGDVVWEAVWSPDGGRLASASSDKTIKVWNSNNGRELLTLGHDYPIESVAWSPDGTKLASGVPSYVVKLWDAESGKELRSIPVPTVRWSGPITKIEWSPDGNSLAWSGAFSDRIQVADTASGSQPRSFRADDEMVRWISWSPDGKRLASTGLDRTTKVWDAASGREIVRMRGHLWEIRTVAWSPDGKLLATAGRDGTIKIWDAASARETPVPIMFADVVAQLTQPSVAPAWSVAWSPNDTRLAASSGNGLIKLWDRASRREISTFKDKSGVRSVAWSPDGQRIATGGYGRAIRVWDASTGIELFACHPLDGGIISLAWSPDGSRLISGADDNTVKIWDAASGSELLNLAGHTQDVAAVAWSPDGTRLASGSGDGVIKMWAAATGKEIATLLGHATKVWRVQWSPDGTRLASASNDNTVKIWDPATGKTLQTLTGHTSLTRCLAWHPDGGRLASGGTDKTVRIWDVKTGNQLLVLPQAHWVWCLAWSHDGRALAATTEDGSVLLYDASAGYSAERSGNP